MYRIRAMQEIDFTAWASHSISLLAFAATLLGILPAITSFVILFFYLLQIWASRPVQDWLHSRRVHRLARLKREAARIEAALLIQDRRNKRD